MRKNKKTLAIVLAVLVAFSTNLASPAFAFAGVMSKKFSNCTALNKKYPGGVARSASVTNRGGSTHYTPTVSSKVYRENKSKDRDKDGIACGR